MKHRVAEWVGLLLSIYMICLMCNQPARAQISFTRVDSQVGIEETIPMWGVSWGDFDSDGYDDVFVGNHYWWSINLYHNDAGAGFTDWAGSSGIPLPSDRHGAVWGDMDNDGWRDLYVAVGAQSGNGVGSNQLYHNPGHIPFVDIAFSAGVTDSAGRGRYPSWIDVDNDGWLDLFITNLLGPNRLFRNQMDGTFAQVADAGGLDEDLLMHAAWTQLSDDPFIDVAMGGNWANRFALFENRGDGSFQDITVASGLSPTLREVRGLCWLDYDNDGNEDLFLCRGTDAVRDVLQFDSRRVLFYMKMQSDPEAENGLDGIDFALDGTELSIEVWADWDSQNAHVYLGSQGVHPTTTPFTMVKGQYEGRPSFVPGVDYGCYIWQDSGQDTWHAYCSSDFAQQHQFGGWIEVIEGTVTSVDAIEIEEPVFTSSINDKLYHHNPDGTFYDASYTAGIGGDISAMACLTADFNNDGWLDLYVVTNHNVNGHIVQNQPNLLYINDQNGHFTECAVAAGVACQVPGTSVSAAWGDYDDDGFIDLFTTNGYGFFPFNLGPQVLYRNEGNDNHWVKFRLVGTESNRDGIGTRIRLSTDGMTQCRTQNGATHSMSQSSQVVHFGLGEATLIDAVRVDWPSGLVDNLTNLQVDTTYVLVEGTLAAIPTEPPQIRSGLHLRAVNPAHAGALLAYELPVAAVVRLQIYSTSGRLLRTLFEGRMPVGPHRLDWDGTDSRGRSLAPGIYHARLEAGGAAQVGRIVLVD